MPIFCRYGRVSSAEQRKGLERILFSLEQTVVELGGDLQNSPLFIDVESGRKTDRAGFLELLTAIERKRVDILVTYRVDRLARNLEDSIKLQRLLEHTGIRLYEIQQKAYFDFTNPDDWQRFCQKSVEAEAESRRLSRRISDGYKFSRHKGKACSRPAWGYIRNPQTERCEVDPSLAEAVAGTIAIVLQERNFQKSCRLIAERYGKQWKPNTLRLWISNPVLRGHTGYKRNNRSWGEIRYNTHPDHAVLTEEEYSTIATLIEERRQYWGANAQRNPHPLGGLVFCGRCNMKMAIVHGGNGRYYFSCRSRVHHTTPERCPQKRSIRVEEVESVVVEALIESAASIALIAATPSQKVKSPKQLELEALLTSLNKLGDNPALSGSKEALRLQIAMLETDQGSGLQEIEENRSLLLEAFSSISNWSFLRSDEKRAIFKPLVQSVVVDCAEVKTEQLTKTGKIKLRLDWSILVNLKPLGVTAHPSSEPQNNLRRRSSILDYKRPRIQP